MILFAIGVLLFVGIGVYLIAQRTEMSHAMSLFFGSQLAPGCAVAMGVLFLLLALGAVVLQQRGLFGVL